MELLRSGMLPPSIPKCQNDRSTFRFVGAELSASLGKPT